MGSIHVCTPSCTFVQDGNRFVCNTSGNVHVCGSRCKKASGRVLGGGYCALTHMCHDGMSTGSPRTRSPTGSHNINQKDRFFRNAKNVIYCIKDDVDDDMAERLATECLSVFSRVKDNTKAFECIHTINHRYLALSILYMLMDGMSSGGVQVVPHVVALRGLLPNKCDIHKSISDEKARVAKRNRRGAEREGGVRKRALTNATRSVQEALRVLIAR